MATSLTESHHGLWGEKTIRFSERTGHPHRPSAMHSAPKPLQGLCAIEYLETVRYHDAEMRYSILHARCCPCGGRPTWRSKEASGVQRVSRTNCTVQSVCAKKNRD